MAHLRQFSTGANRDAEEGKLDFEGFLSPMVLYRYAEYMLAHQHTQEGLRASDNWQLGIPQDAYMKSLIRHTFDLWLWYRTKQGHPEESACGIFFNVQGFLHEYLKAQTIQIVSTNGS